jgi:hypothetical protein
VAAEDQLAPVRTVYSVTVTAATACQAAPIRDRAWLVWLV